MDHHPRSCLESALPQGHWDALEQMENPSAFEVTRERYESFFGTYGVYFRLVEKGFTVLSLDHENCQSMIGVGDRGDGMECLATLPPDEVYVKKAYEGYLRKRDSLKRKSGEERFALRCIREALSNGLRFPNSDLLFLHQEWRMPTHLGGGKLDLLAINAATNRLAVVELKGSQDKTRTPDKCGRNAQEQAEHYADVLFQYREELYPFFARLAQVMMLHYGNTEDVKAIAIDKEQRPETCVWWPDF